MPGWVNSALLVHSSCRESPSGSRLRSTCYRQAWQRPVQRLKTGFTESLDWMAEQAYERVRTNDRKAPSPQTGRPYLTVTRCSQCAWLGGLTRLPPGLAHQHAAAESGQDTRRDQDEEQRRLEEVVVGPQMGTKREDERSQPKPEAG